MARRKVIQIAASVIQIGEVTAPIAFVLTNDGKVYTTVPSRSGEAPTWKELPEVPQDAFYPATLDRPQAPRG